ncbi:MAG: winged helix-turn-helix domain-containing protein [Pseudomonadota bacterium]
MLLTFGGWTLDTDSRDAVSEQRSVRLSPRAVQFLVAFARTRKSVLSRSELMEAIWPGIAVGDDSLTQVVVELRKKLADHDLVETVSRTGYRFRKPIHDSLEQADGVWRSTVSQADEQLEAHALCIEAQYIMERCGRRSIERAEELTAESVERAPASAYVRSRNAIALVRRDTYRSGQKRFLHRALVEARKAVELDPHLALAHSAHGYALSMLGDRIAAEKAHGRAIELDRCDPTVFHNAAWHLMSSGRIRSAVRFFELSCDLAPSTIKGYVVAAQLSQRMDPTRSGIYAKRALQRVHLRLDIDRNDPRALAAQASISALLGDTEAAQSAMDRLEAGDAALAIFRASAKTLLGEHAEAVLLFEELLDHGWRDRFWFAADPTYEALQSRKFDRMRRQLMSR